MNETQQTLSDTELGNKNQVLKYCKDWKNDKKKKRNWFLTWNNYPSDGVETLKTLGKQAKYFVFQEERGEEGTPHIQGVICFHNAKTRDQVREKVRGWWAPCRNVEASKVYCSKIDTRIGPTHVKGFVLKEQIYDVVEKKGYFEWQKKIVKLIEEYDHENDEMNRVVHWFWEQTGGIGKTCFCKHLFLKYGAVYVGGRATDVKFAISQMSVKPKIVLWDIDRDWET